MWFEGRSRIWERRRRCLAQAGRCRHFVRVFRRTCAAVPRPPRSCAAGTRSTAPPRPLCFRLLLVFGLVLGFVFVLALVFAFRLLLGRPPPSRLRLVRARVAAPQAVRARRLLSVAAQFPGYRPEVVQKTCQLSPRARAWNDRGCDNSARVCTHRGKNDRQSTSSSTSARMRTLSFPSSRQSLSPSLPSSSVSSFPGRLPTSRTQSASHPWIFLCSAKPRCRGRR